MTEDASWLPLRLLRLASGTRLLWSLLLVLSGGWLLLVDWRPFESLGKSHVESD